MLSLSTKHSLRRIWLVTCCLLAPLVVAVGVAWACTPQANINVEPQAALAGSAVTVEGSNFVRDRPVEIRWSTGEGSPAEWPLLATARGPDFSSEVTIPNAPPGNYYLVALARDDAGDVVGQAVASFRVKPAPGIDLQPASGRAGTQALVEGRSFEPDGRVEIRWSSATGPLLATASGPAFSAEVTVPDVSPGPYTVLALGYDNQGNPASRAASAFQVAEPPPPPPPLVDFAGPPFVDFAGPPLFSSALTRGNGTRTVSRRGYFRLFCGRFEEAGVTGRCGAGSSQAVRVRGARFRRIGAKPFRAQPGVPAYIRLRLSRSNRRILRAAKTIRMRGSVVARDAAGNTTKAPFRFMLRAPKAATRRRSLR